MYPGKNFIGIDKKGERIWAGATRGEALNLSNIAFLRIGIEQVAEYFGEGEVDEIWITFPGPFPKKPNKRLSAEKFLKEYQKIIKPEGILHFKTDDPDLFQFTLDSLDNYNAKVLQVISDVHHVEHGNAELDIITDFERRHIAKGRKIYYVRFQF
jgi:tRNA (guanine-N7-)-methyltransferase